MPTPDSPQFPKLVGGVGGVWVEIGNICLNYKFTYGSNTSNIFFTTLACFYIFYLCYLEMEIDSPCLHSQTLHCIINFLGSFHFTINKSSTVYFQLVDSFLGSGSESNISPEVCLAYVGECQITFSVIFCCSYFHGYYIVSQVVLFMLCCKPQDVQYNHMMKNTRAVTNIT